MAVRAFIFDFDGVIADSELLANTVLADYVSGLGMPTTVEDALATYMGKRWPEVVDLIQKGFGRSLPESFADDLKLATFKCFGSDLREVRGAAAFLRRFPEIRRCIASSSSLDRLKLCLDILGLAGDFGNNVFSADMVARGKPHPDIFLYAAEKMDVSAGECLVIEDSVGGVRAAVAAGMLVLGLCAASHIKEGHAQALSEAGASYTAKTWDDALRIVTKLRSTPQTGGEKHQSSKFT
jgi:HAD superfamily hydrolase (TIGR01549 family)